MKPKWIEPLVPENGKPPMRILPVGAEVALLIVMLKAKETRLPDKRDRAKLTTILLSRSPKLHR